MVSAERIRRRRGPARVAAAAVVALLIPLGGNPQAHAQASEWVRVEPPVGIRPQATLNAVTALGRGHAWAVGKESEGVSQSAPGVPLVLRLDGRRWVRVPLPRITWQGELLSVAAVGPRDVWATGRDYGGLAHVLRYDGTTWRDVTFPGAGTRYQQLRVVASPGRAPWIVTNGKPFSASPVLMRWTGTEWIDVPRPPAQLLEAAHVGRDGTVWVAGFDLIPIAPITTELAVYRWTGDGWEALPRGVDMVPHSILPGPGGTLWVGGSRLTFSNPIFEPRVTTLASWDGTAWRTVDLPDLIYPPELSGDDQGRPEWAAGASIRTGDWYAPRYLKYVGGVWTPVPLAPLAPPESGAAVHGIAHVPGTNSTLAVGRAGAPDYAHPVARIEREDSP